MSTHPEVLWAQRSSETDEEKVRYYIIVFQFNLAHCWCLFQNFLYVTINLPDIVESSLEYTLTATSISFKAKAGE